MALFDTLKTVLTPYAEKINDHTTILNDHDVSIKSLDKDVVCLNHCEIDVEGELIKGFYPVAGGTMSSSSSSARLAVFPVEPLTDYYISWLSGSNKYRVAFGDVAKDDLVDGSPVYGYVDANTLSHDHFKVRNNEHSYMYVYIGSSADATMDSISVVKKMSDVIKTVDVEEVEWVPASGTIGISNGAAGGNAKRIRTKGSALPIINKGDYIVCDSDYQFKVLAYTGTLSTTNFIGVVTPNWITGKYEVPDDLEYKFLAMVIGRIDDANMTSEVSTIRNHVKIYRTVSLFKPKTANNERFTVSININWPGSGISDTNQETESNTDILSILRLPNTYSRDGKPVPLIMYGHGRGCQITESSWYSNRSTFSAMLDTFVNAGYAIFDVNNTRDNSDGYPDWGSLPLMTAYIKAWEYIKQNYNVEHRLYILSSSMGTCANLNMMKWYGADVVASIMTAPRPICSARYAAYVEASDSSATEMATAFGLSGTEWESERLAGFDQYENTITLNDKEYAFEHFPPIKVLVGGLDTDFLTETRGYFAALHNAGNYVNYREVDGADHDTMCFLSTGTLKEEALNWFNRFNN